MSNLGIYILSLSLIIIGLLQIFGVINRKSAIIDRLGEKNYKAISGVMSLIIVIIIILLVRHLFF